MKKYLFLSSAFIMTTLGAFGADGTITGGANTCTVDVLGVSDNNATANTIATWSLNEYDLNPGQYLSVTDTSVDKTTCPAGSYCVGGTGFTVDNAKNSIAQCPAEYPNSAEGAGTDTQCYTACTVDMVAKATAVTGNDYYGAGVDTCGATACETGYHVNGEMTLVEKTPLIPVDYTKSHIGYASIGMTGEKANWNMPDYSGLIENNSWASLYDYGVVYGRGSCQPTLHDPGLQYFYDNVLLVGEGRMSLEELRTGLIEAAGTEKAKTLISYLEVMISGGEGYTEEEMNKLQNLLYWYSISSDSNLSPNSTGGYCYCQITGFMPNGGGKEVVVSAPWVASFSPGYSSGDCANECPHDCATISDSGFHAAMFGALGVSQGGICEANTINIDWNPDNGGEHTKNMCTYDGSITLPTPDPVKPGYTFTGWKLLENTTTE